ncbi:hypothetical protein [Pseudosulfitobacter pseudonitzschiae]|uniref:hypothetical protein n=1 Tax=Pseudosulfitobacter pseudonitzschiae TaxID=1402135 RepID=UPI001CD52F94|nr:hypothetical protein [Pseudosulfitobacter pseudonitzschiae]
MTYGILYEELARIWADLAIAVLIQGLAVFAVNLLRCGRQKDTYLKPLLRSERICATCISEPEVGSNVREVKTRANVRGTRFSLRPKAMDFQRGAIDFASWSVISTMGSPCHRRSRQRGAMKAASCARWGLSVPRPANCSLTGPKRRTPMFWGTPAAVCSRH